MSNLYGYESAISAGNQFSARIANYNDAIKTHNDVLTAKYNADLKNAPGKRASDKTKEEEDGAFYGISDGKGVIGSTIGMVKEGAKIDQAAAEAGGLGAGLLKYAGDSITERKGAISKTINRLGEMPVKKAQAAMKPTTVDSDGIVQTEGAIEDGADDAGKAAAKAAGEEIESSGIGTGILKAGLKKVAGGAVSEAGLTVASELGGKVAGDLGGFVDIGEGISNMLNGSSFFAGEDKTAAFGDTLQSVGAVADVVGTIFPPLELVGGALGAIGGVIDGWDSIDNDLKQKKKDAADPKPPSLTATKVSPAFSAMGLVASAPITAKQQITGS
jgi:hypothetical protein